MVIRQTQMDTLLEEKRSAFVRRAAAELDRAHPELVFELAPGELERRLRQTVDRATAFRIGREGSVMLMAVMELRLGEEFAEAPEHKWAVRVLQSGYLSPEAQRRALNLAYVKAP